jgi:flagellar protein FliS
MSLAQRYRQTQKETASKERLLVMVMEAAERNMREGIAALDGGRGPAAAEPLTRASDIVLALRATFDTEIAPELAATLLPLYDFVASRLTLAAARRDANLAREAQRAFHPIADAFAQAMANLAPAAAAPR